MNTPKKTNILVVLGIGIIGSLLVACQTEKPNVPSVTAAENSNAICDSFNKGDDMRGQLEAPTLKVKVPLGRFKDPKRGISTVILGGSEPSLNVFWLYQNSQGNWAMADKQTVVRLQPGEMDTELLHRLNPQVYPKTVLFIVLPQDYWDKEIFLQPVLEKHEARWGKVEYYNMNITAQGIVHPFRGLHELGNSGDKLPPHLNKVLNQVNPGSLYLPNKLRNNVKLLQPTLVNQKICPKSGS